MSRSSATDGAPLPRLAPRAADSHKGDFGRALLIGGSLGMTGAISLAGSAALRSGAGLVKLAVPDVCLPIVASFEPSYMTIPLRADPQGRIAAGAESFLGTALSEATAVACGPGLGRSDDLTKLVGWLYRNLTQPLLVDADALNALAAQPTMLDGPAGPRILTPHPGEFARLIGGAKVAPDRGDSDRGDSDRGDSDKRESAAKALALRAKAVIVLKGHRTLITDGNQVAVNTTGNPGMATGGTGDVLCGIITALVCQGLSPFDAARLGACAHGLAGDLAAVELGQVGMIARDLLTYLPQAFLQLA